MVKDSLLRKYARLIVRVGVNVQPEQEVEVYAAVDQTRLVHMVVAEAYAAGASAVRVEWQDEELIRQNYQHMSLRKLSRVLKWQREKMKQRVKDLPCQIHIVSDDPDGRKGVDVQKMMKANAARSKIFKPYRDEMENKYQWVIVAASSEKWARKVFPEETTAQAVDHLWKMIFECVYLDEESDPIENWKKHNERFIEKCAWLNAQHFTKLRYHSANGTDFEVGLIPTAQFMGGGEYSTQNIYYNPNMPTEEIYTSPMRGQAQGTLVATKPLSYQGHLIDGFSITFENGKVSEVHAKVGEELLQKMVQMDEGASYLGEVALVPKESPINRSNILFYETLFDENASCHVALGMGFSNVLLGFEKMNDKEFLEAGINDSIIHVDFMIGSPDLEIVGIKADGTEVPVFKNGTWA